MTRGNSYAMMAQFTGVIRPRSVNIISVLINSHAQSNRLDHWTINLVLATLTHEVSRYIVNNFDLEFHDIAHSCLKKMGDKFQTILSMHLLGIDVWTLIRIPWSNC